MAGSLTAVQGDPRDKADTCGENHAKAVRS